jgi:GNAT superfamily N-acetyltransferase
VIFRRRYAASKQNSLEHRYRVAALAFTNEAVDHYSGQTNLVLTAKKDGVVVGTIEYTEYRGVPSIGMVTVSQEYRRQGIATQMLRQLQLLYPDVEIGGQDNLTDLGARWNQSLPWQDRPNQRYQELAEEKAQLEVEAARLMALYDRGEVPKEQLGQLGDDLNAVHDRLYQIEEEIHGMKPSRRIFTGAAGVRAARLEDTLTALARSLGVDIVEDSLWAPPGSVFVESGCHTVAFPREFYPKGRDVDRAMVQALREGLLPCLDPLCDYCYPDEDLDD